MKLLVIFILFLIFSRPVQGQLISGRIIDSSNAEPLEYVSIGIVGTSVATLTDENGNFKVDVTDLPSEAIIRISMISYEPQTFLIKDLINKVNSIKLISISKQLPEVIIRPSEKPKIVGTSDFNKYAGITGWVGSELAKGYEMGLKIKLGNVPVKLRTLHINVYKQSFDTSVFRLHVRQIIHKMPSDELLSTNIFIPISESSGWVNFDISKYNLVFKGDIALTLEWIKVIGIHEDKFWQPIKSKKPKKAKPIVFFNRSKHGCIYNKWGSENTWHEGNRSPSIYLTVQETMP